MLFLLWKFSFVCAIHFDRFGGFFLVVTRVQNAAGGFCVPLDLGLLVTRQWWKHQHGDL
jgi:hypothetical protein